MPSKLVKEHQRINRMLSEKNMNVTIDYNEMVVLRQWFKQKAFGVMFYRYGVLKTGLFIYVTDENMFLSSLPLNEKNYLEGVPVIL